METGQEQDVAPPAIETPSIAWPAAALAILLALQFTLVFTRAINWDEYSYFREVAFFADGQLSRPLQTIHTRLFAWLPGLFETSTDHIVAARIFMFGCELITVICLVVIARRFASLQAAAFIALAYISAGYVLHLGTSFRVDPLVTAFLCAALAVLAAARLNLLAIIGFGLLAGLAAMVSVKAVLYFPAFAGIAIWRWQQSAWSCAELARLALSAAAALVSFGVIYAFHSQGVTSDSGATGSAQKVVNTAGNWAFFFGIPPYWQMALKAALTAPVLAIMIAIMPAFLWRSNLSAIRKIALLGCWLPITSIFFYTNTAAYFYVFILAPVAIACAPVMETAIERYSARMLALVLLTIGCGIWLLEDRSMIDRQRQLENNVHEVFAEPVPYFDHNYMLGGWPKMNNFLTPWGIDAYHRNSRPAYRDAMEERVIPLYLANYPLLEESIAGERDDLFFAEDLAALRSNYVEFSWPIWVAGKDFSARTGSFSEEFLVPGLYTVEGGDIEIDGKMQLDGSTSQIERGLHQITIRESQAIKLIWGDHLIRPSQPLERGELYVEF